MKTKTSISDHHGDFLTRLLLSLLRKAAAAHHQAIMWTYFYDFMMKQTIYYPVCPRGKRTLQKLKKTKKSSIISIQILSLFLSVNVKSCR
jgi:hypothetical protein